MLKLILFKDFPSWWISRYPVFNSFQDMCLITFFGWLDLAFIYFKVVFGFVNSEIISANRFKSTSKYWTVLLFISTVILKFNLLNILYSFSWWSHYFFCCQGLPSNHHLNRYHGCRDGQFWLFCSRWIFSSKGCEMLKLPYLDFFLSMFHLCGTMQTYNNVTPSQSVGEL